MVENTVYHKAQFGVRKELEKPWFYSMSPINELAAAARILAQIIFMSNKSSIDEEASFGSLLSFGLMYNVNPDIMAC